MSDNPKKKEPPQANDLLKNSSLYREFQEEREEILRHKWIESEKAGRDIGFERALTDWIIRHRRKWRKSRAGVGSATSASEVSVEIYLNCDRPAKGREQILTACGAFMNALGYEYDPDPEEFKRVVMSTL